MARFLNRLLSSLVFAAYLLGAYFSGYTGSLRDHILDVLELAAALLLPMAAIWFGDILGSYTGIISGDYINTSSPGRLVCAAGWFILVGVPIVAYFLIKTM